jgi:hypothetical protein
MSKLHEYIKKAKMIQEDRIDLDFKPNDGMTTVPMKDNLPENRAFNAQLQTKIEEIYNNAKRNNSAFVDYLKMFPKYIDSFFKTKIKSKITLDISDEYQKLIKILASKAPTFNLAKVGINGTEIEVKYDYENILKKTEKDEVTVSIDLTESFRNSIQSTLSKL